MTQIQDYVLMIVGACLTCGGLSVLAPSGQFAKIIRIISSIFLMLCMLSPLVNAFSSISDYSIDLGATKPLLSSSQVWEHTAQTMSSTMERTIHDHVTTVTGHVAQNVEVTISYEDHAFVLSDIQIILSSADADKVTAVCDYVTWKTGVRPTVISQ